jgi:hypothetical protein
MQFFWMKICSLLKKRNVVDGKLEDYHFFPKEVGFWHCMPQHFLGNVMARIV